MDLDAFPDGIIVAGPDERVILVNRRARHMGCMAPEIGMHLHDAMPFDDLHGNHWFTCTQPYGGLTIRKRLSEQSWWAADGREFLIDASLVRDRPAGDVQRVIVTIRTARIRNQRDRQRSDMIATLAHELRSPLTGIKGFTATLLNNWDRFSDEQRRFMLEAVDADTDRLGRLITELLDASRIDAGRLTLRRGPVDIAAVTRHVVPVLADTDGLVLNIDDDIGVIWGDNDRITQVLTNLVENAQRHGDGLSQVDILDSTAEIGAAGVLVRIYDRGDGIAAEDRQRVFSRFWKSGGGAGSGLGLYIVRGIVEQHGGWIHMSDGDHMRGGTVATVWLPVNEPAGLTDDTPTVDESAD